MMQEDVRDMVAAYALGVLDEHENKRVETAITPGDEESWHLVAEMQQIAALLPYAADEVTPSQRVKVNLVAAIRDEGFKPAAATIPPPAAPAPPGRLDTGMLDTFDTTVRRWRRRTWGLAAGLVAAVILLLMHISDLQRTLRSLHSQNTISSDLVEQLRIRLNNQEQVIGLLRSSQVQIVDLSGQSPSPQARGILVFNPQQAKAFLYAENLAAPPASHDYRLWLLEGSRPVSAGIFRPAANGEASLLVEQVANVRRVTGFAVTLEPKGSATEPLGQIHLMGMVKGR